jgi:hypothetical protein
MRYKEKNVPIKSCKEAKLQAICDLRSIKQFSSIQRVEQTLREFNSFLKQNYYEPRGIVN